MSHSVDYYFAPQSPWAYLGHQRFQQILDAAGASVRVMPIDLGGKVFPISGGLPLGQRAPQRQAYRLTELARFSKWLGAPLHLKPTYFPVGGDDAAKLIIAVDMAAGAKAAMAITGAILSAVWAQQRNIADEKTLAELLKEQNLPASCLEQAYSQAVQMRYESYTQMAIDAGVFGAPSYVVDGEIFWGQDRLDFVERALTSSHTSRSN
ncbi:MAG: 2-hydroxychromene-2-carboxylate isomerase [Betaproteobacteria bacterium]|nr:2-hydroxychromene-2-carboxylate isomerase [Betaproteobacteria bacterium]NBZ99866.1 2-hydroxychromene-2-carboxylate isomerase [Betaproteobacteria bacterium]NDB43025.1 2-hydroxychromene-2-carboxylate isomerase [Betaproteobacteria bacterium]NDD00580.1 2-hydroxychromene-2-carboxylate isomerase [Betaproteobacteria bacterium]NDD23368.1 2-hydroxychromene-2-carboxylate isomerase [Betaproteobacteria bacterium]